MTDAEEPVAVFKKRNNKNNLRKRPATPPPEDSPSNSDSDDFGSDEDDQLDGPKVKRPRKAGVAAGATNNKDGDKSDIIDVLGVTKYTGDRSTTIDISNDATKQSNWYDEKDLLGTTRAIKEPVTSSISLSGREKKAPGTMGPVKAPTNVRMVTVVDYAPDVCKDYKQTGFCGFGDNCKFLHAREDYKQGWALDKEWENVSRGSKKMKGTIIASASNRGASNAAKDEAEDEKDAKELEKIPFKCTICKEDYKDPVVTKCSHYFCERCALGRYKKNTSCAQCGESTNGVFNVARNLKKILEKKHAREKRLRKEQEEAEAEEDDE